MTKEEKVPLYFGTSVVYCVMLPVKFLDSNSDMVDIEISDGSPKFLTDLSPLVVAQ